MKLILFLLNLILCLSVVFYSQVPDEQEIKLRQEKFELILRMQDTRTVHDGKLISFLTDIDPVVRERAVLAFGSIQDTNVINLLINRLDEDPDYRVKYAAAFAIGQTAGLLCEKSLKKLQHDLIWTRINKLENIGKGKIRPANRLIEEIGKFGTEEALSDLMLRFSNVNPPVYNEALVMSIARFAIRGIVIREAVQFLLKQTKPMETTPWQVVYALQRIGEHPEIRSELTNIAQLYKHSNPFARMYVAMLLGKVRDEKICLEPLLKLADFDNDWRVRVNALKALSNYDLNGRDNIVTTFRRLFFSGNIHIATTAISTFGNTKLKKKENSKTFQETFADLEKIALNKNNEYLWQLQGEAAISLAKLEGKDAIVKIKLKNNLQPRLQSQLINALGITGAPEVLPTLLEYVGNNKPILYCAALEGLRELSKRNQNDTLITNKAYDMCINALQSNDVAVVATSASILADSLFLRNDSVEPLLNSLSKLRVPDDLEAMQEIIATLGKIKDTRALEVLKRQLNQRDRSVVLVAASALRSITGQDYSTLIPRYFEPFYTDFDYKYLNYLSDTVRVKMETIRGDVIMELYKNYAPFTVMSFLKLATQRGFYRGLSFHRIVPNFVVQGGDPRGDGWGGPGYTIRSEFSPLTYETGTIGMANSGKDTEGSQFFITQSPQPHLDGRYTIFGKVISGMDVINKIQLDDHIFDVKVLR